MHYLHQNLVEIVEDEILMQIDAFVPTLLVISHPDKI